MGASSLSIYIHIPFCRQRCAYCAFNTYAGQESLIPAYVDALCREITLIGRAGGQPPVHTIFFGGGTPSLLTPDQVGQVLETLACAFTLAFDVEVTLEANPASSDHESFQALRNLGVNRLSLGAQSALEPELRFLRRDHSWKDVRAAVAAARAARFDNLSLDLIYGIPGQTLAGWRESLAALLALQPEHVSLYSLSIEPRTALQVWVDRGQVDVPDSDLAADMYDQARSILAKQGYQHYEISNWARDGYECRHNLQVWRGREYLGFGAGAHGYAADYRYQVVDSPWRYVHSLSAGTLAVQLPDGYPFSPAVDQESIEKIGDQLARSEVMLLGLRLVEEGVSRTAFERRFGLPVEAFYQGELNQLVARGMITIGNTNIRLTEVAYLIANQVLVNFV